MTTQNFAPASARLVLITAAALLALAPLQGRAESVVVVNAATNAQLDDALLAKIFLRQVKSFPDGSPAAPVNQKEGATTEEFRAKVLKKNAAQFKAFWAQQIFTGGAKPPQELDGDEAVLKFVAETPGGIGYVAAGKTRAGVRVLQKSARAPRDHAPGIASTLPHRGLRSLTTEWDPSATAKWTSASTGARKAAAEKATPAEKPALCQEGHQGRRTDQDRDQRLPIQTAFNMTGLI